MICLGYDSAAKTLTVEDYVREHGIERTVVLSPTQFRFAVEAPHEMIDYAEIIMYRTYYRLLQNIDSRTLVVVNECLRTQSRHDLTYNCIRNFLNQTTHQIVFQYLPLIDGHDDFATLFDFDTRSRWKRERWERLPLGESEIRVEKRTPRLLEVPVEVDEKTRASYARKKRELIDGIGLRDPHTIPRNLYLLSGRAKVARVQPGNHYVGRNNRFGLAAMHTYRDEAFPAHCTAFELPHDFIRLADFLALSKQPEVPVMVADLKVDRWYHQRAREWAQRIEDAYAAIQR